MILGEFGITQQTNMSFKRGVIKDSCHYFHTDETAYSALMMTEMIFAAINAGIFALALWSYTDYPDPYSCAYSEKGYAKAWGEAERFISGTTDVKYNKWGMTKWEDNHDYSARDHYWCIGLIGKYFKRNSKVMEIECENPSIRLCAIQNKDGSISVGVVNRSKNKAAVEIDAGGLVGKAVRVYEYDSNNVPRNSFCDLQKHSALLDKGDRINYELLPASVTIFTTDYIERNYPVRAAGLEIQNGFLLWDEICDNSHCYYRVFASTEYDFAPSIDTQIASTVENRIPIENEYLHYIVLSVDKSGNC